MGGYGNKKKKNATTIIQPPRQLETKITRLIDIKRYNLRGYVTMPMFSLISYYVKRINIDPVKTKVKYYAEGKSTLT